MSKVINMSLSVSSINDAIKEIQKYQKSLDRKCEMFCYELMKIGAKEARFQINASPLGNMIHISSEITPESQGCRAILFGTGSDLSNNMDDRVANALLLVEFGSGIFYNSVENPKASELGMGVGTFPEQKHAFENGWYYLDDNGTWQYSHGVRATMPMYKSYLAMYLQCKKIAKAVFSSD